MSAFLAGACATTSARKATTAPPTTPVASSTSAISATATIRPGTAKPTPTLAAAPSARSTSVATPTAAQTAAATRTIAIGAGPQTHYTIERQPPAGSCHYTVVDAAMGEYLPDPKCTPGAISPAVTQDNLASTICKKGYTKSVRPPEDVTDAEKAANAASYSYTGSLKTAEYDHFIPLELGGDPNDPRNLWVEPNDATATTVNNPKDGVESSLNYLVCNAIHGKPYLPLAKAQELIATNWTTAKVLARQLLVSN